MTSKKHIVKNLFLALSPIVAYNIINLICFILFAVKSMPNPETILDSDSILPYQYFKFDSIFCIIMLGIFYLWLSRIHRHSPEVPSLTESHMLVKIPIITFGMNGISSLWFLIIALWLQTIPLISDSLDSFEDTWSGIETEPYGWVLLSVVIAGPIVEELLFRGIMFHYLEKIKSGWFPVLISGIAFGLWHMEPVQVVYAALMGIILGIIYAKVRSLKVTIAIHMLNNFLSTLPPFMNTEIVQIFIFYASFLMILPTIYVLIRMIRKQSTVQAPVQSNDIS